MPLAQLRDHHRDLICPRCSSPLVPAGSGYLCSGGSCPWARDGFPMLAGVPALVDFEHSVVDRQLLERSMGASPLKRSQFRLAGLLHPPNRRAADSVRRLLGLLREHAGPARPLVLVVGGGVVGSGLDDLYEAPDVEVMGLDIYVSPLVQMVADAHRIPLAPSSVDGVVVQAVLEHVLDPVAVVGEIHRVLRPGGLVYADTPFLQQVHEGPYDFTRFTDSGHRYLFRKFERIESGAVAGAGTQLAWSIDYFVRALLRWRRAGLAARMAVGWLARLDPILDPSFSLDGASSVYFLGRKSSVELSAREAIEYYQGAQ